MFKAPSTSQHQSLAYLETTDSKSDDGDGGHLGGRAGTMMKIDNGLMYFFRPESPLFNKSDCQA
jgi:hypothetical protein